MSKDENPKPVIYKGCELWDEMYGAKEYVPKPFKKICVTNPIVVISSSNNNSSSSSSLIFNSVMEYLIHPFLSLEIHNYIIDNNKEQIIGDILKCHVGIKCHDQNIISLNGSSSQEKMVTKKNQVIGEISTTTSQDKKTILVTSSNYSILSDNETKPISEISINPISEIFAWVTALNHMADLENNVELKQFAFILKKSCIVLVESGKMTSDLVTNIKILNGECLLKNELENVVKKATTIDPDILTTQMFIFIINTILTDYISSEFKLNFPKKYLEFLFKTGLYDIEIPFINVNYYQTALNIQLVFNQPNDYVLKSDENLWEIIIGLLFFYGVYELEYYDSDADSVEEENYKKKINTLVEQQRQRVNFFFSIICTSFYKIYNIKIDADECINPKGDFTEKANKFIETIEKMDDLHHLFNGPMHIKSFTLSIVNILSKLETVDIEYILNNFALIEQFFLSAVIKELDKEAEMIELVRLTSSLFVEEEKN